VNEREDVRGLKRDGMQMQFVFGMRGRVGKGGDGTTWGTSGSFI